MFLQVSQHIKPVFSRHLEVENEKIDLAKLKQLNGRFTVGGLINGKIMPAQKM